MAYGLGFAQPNPELARARNLAKLNGSTALPQGAGTAQAPVIQPPANQSVGPATAPSPESVQPLPMPDAAMPDRSAQLAQAASTANPEKDVDWARALQAIGYTIQAADAGYRGTAMPESPEAQWAKEDAEEARRVEAGVQIMMQAWEASRKAPPEKRAALLQAYKAAAQKMDPNFDFDAFMEEVSTDADRADMLAPQIAMMSPEAKAMFMSGVRARGGDAQAAASLIKDDDFMATIFDFEDNRNSSAVQYKMAALRAQLKKMGLPDNALNLDPDKFAGLNEQLPKQMRLSPSELATLKRHPEYLGGISETPRTARNQTLDSRAGTGPAMSEDEDDDPGVGDTLPDTPPEEVGPPPRRPAPSRHAPPTTSGQAPGHQRVSAPAPVNVPPPRPPKPRAKGQPLMPAGTGPVYTRPGYDPALADPATQRALREEGKKHGVDVDDPRVAEQIEDRIAEGPPKPRQAKRQTPPPQPAAPPPQRSRVQRFSIPPGGRTIPGIGPMKEGEMVEYDPRTKRYRRVR